MTDHTLSSSAPFLARLARFLRLELAPFPGRMDALLRFLLATALVMLVTISLDVPLLVLGIIVVFFTAQENTVYTVLAAVLMVAGSLLTDILCIALMDWSFDYPLVRISIATFIVFVGMWFFRASPLGSLGYMAALCVIFSQSFYDQLPSPEMLIRMTLWTFVVLLYSAAITVAINLLVRPARPKDMLLGELDRQLDATARQLEGLLEGAEPPRLSALDVERGIMYLHRNFTFAAMGDKSLRARKSWHLARMGAAERVYAAAAQVARLRRGSAPVAVSDDLLPGIRQLKSMVNDLREAVRNRSVFHTREDLVFRSAEAPALAAELQEMANALAFLSRAADMENGPPDLPDLPDPPEPPDPASPAEPAEQGGLFVPDAFSNPAYTRFAFKTTLATLFCYGFYTAVQWEGIHTCMLTCIITALPSLGATSQKGVLRFAGCACGSLLTLLATLFVVPHLESIAGFLVLSLVVIGAGAWVAAGSERSNYAGVQIVFAYVLALCEQYYPTTDMVEIRDRLFGIVIGVIVSTVVYALLWPERDTDNLRGAFARLFRSLADFVRPGEKDASPEQRQHARSLAQSRCWTQLGACRELHIRVVLEPDWRYASDSSNVGERDLIGRAQELLPAASHVQALLGAPALPEEAAEACAAILTLAERRLRALADSLDGKTAAGSPAEDAVSAPLAVIAAAHAHAASGGEARAACAELLPALRSFLDVLDSLRPDLLQSIVPQPEPPLQESAESDISERTSPKPTSVA